MSAEPETMEGIAVREIELGELNERKHEVAALTQNVLDTDKSQIHEGSFGQRKEAIHHIGQEIQQAGEHTLNLVAEENGKIVGFISIDKRDGIARVKEMWVRPAEERRVRVIAKLIDSALHELHNGPTHYAKLHIAPVSPIKGLSLACANLGRARQLVIEKSSSEHPAAANDNTNESLEKAA